MNEDPTSYPSRPEQPAEASLPGESPSSASEVGSGSSQPPGANLPPVDLPESGVPESDFRALDGRVISYWRVHSLISTAILLVLALIGGAVLAFNFRDLVPVVIAVWLVFMLFRIFWLYWYPTRSYRAWGYRIDEKVLETRQGIWFKTITLLPLSRLQHVDLHRGPMERGFGLASLVLHTAGSMNATIVIPGLEADLAAQLRDHLVAVGGDDGV